MGSILRATCSCGFIQEWIPLGGGMRNYETVCSAPALCTSCGLLVCANYLDDMPRCPCGGTVRFYNDPALYRTPVGELTVADWNIREKSFSLPDTHYLCPKCSEMNMHFRFAGCFD
ncbi:conserved hypothetical protein [Ktedonobacter racemifer DSM 44963]|uniref:Uncharacterized protein n=1 Tax=Ktedonobacter racemifer DSM 44963 TaxID=485913 RepID=D6U040_KTERA|nr:conserved hypothetical protein [Ktedonobacter racemifer DSM 44963]